MRQSPVFGALALVLALPGASRAVILSNGPWVAHVDKDLVVLAWDTDAASGTLVNYGTTPAYGSQATGTPATVSASGWANHSIVITGLQVDTRYYYQVVSGGAVSPPGDPTYYFETAVAESTPYRFVSFADSRGDSSAIELAFGLPADFHAIIDRIAALNPAPRLALFSGDPVYGDDDPAILRQEWDLWKQATDKIHRHMPIYMSPGNHESYHAGAEDMYRAVWEQPHDGGLTPLPALPWNLDELAYSFDYGVVHFASYDTNIDGDPLNYNAPQLETNWLDTDLGSAIPSHRIVFSHTEGANPCPLGLGASLEETSQANYLDLYTTMSNHQTDAYVCGHIHNWVGDQGIMGVREIMNGTCGSISSTSFCGVVADHFVVWDVHCRGIDGRVYDQDGNAVTDRGGVFSVTADNQEPPEVALLTPVSGSHVCGAIPIEASAGAHNCEAVDRVEMYVDGALVGVDRTSPYQITWDSSTVADGGHTVMARAWDTTGAAGLSRDSATAAIDVDNSAPCNGWPANLITGPGAGLPNPNSATIWNAGGALRATWAAYATGKWGTRVAAGEIDGGAIDEAITGPGPGDVFGPHVRGFKRDGTPVAKVTFFAYGTLKYGANVAAGLLDADAFDEILSGPGPGTVFGPHVRGWNFDGVSLTAISKISFFAYNTLRYGVNVAAGSVDADPFAEIVTGPGPGAVFAPQGRGFNYDGAAVTPIAGLNGFLFSTTSYGLVPSTGDLDGDGFAELVVAKGAGPAFDAQVRGYDFDGSALALMAGVDFFPFTGTTAGARVGAGDIDRDGYDEIVAGRGPLPASATTVKGFNVDGGTATPIASTDFTAYGSLGYGVDVAAIDATYP